MALSKEQDIWCWLKSSTAFSDETIAGIMGNLQAESGCEPCRVQGDFSADRQTSKDYADSVDLGAITNWATDSKGWGLCQWTYYTRKNDLLAYAQTKGKSIADLNTQLEFMMNELGTSEYSKLYSQLLTCKDIGTAAELFCRQFEKPAELTKNIINRTNYGKGFFASYSGKDIVQSESDSIEWIRDEIEFLTGERDALNERIAYFEKRLEEADE